MESTTYVMNFNRVHLVLSVVVVGAVASVDKVEVEAEVEAVEAEVVTAFVVV